MLHKARIFALGLGLATLAACGPKDMDVKEVHSLLFPAEGVVGGYDFGDSWDEIKASPNELFEVRDDPDFKQLRRKISDNAGTDGYFIGFILDDEGKVESFNVSINGSKQNAVTVRKLLDDVIARYDAEIGPGSCGRIGDGSDNSSACDWPSVPGKPQVHVMYFEHDEPISGSIDISIMPPGP